MAAKWHQLFSDNDLKTFDIRIVGEEGFVEGLSTEGAYVAFDGHSNFGMGFAWDNNCNSISDFLNMSYPYTGIEWDWLKTMQQPDMVFPENDIVQNPSNYLNCIELERFENVPWMYMGTNIPYVATQSPSNIFTTVYGSGDERFH